jgi:hypothetical protein
MPTPTAIIWLVLLIAAAAISLVLMHRRDRRHRQMRRSRLFESSYDLFQSYRVEQAGQDFPSLKCRYRDHDFVVDVVVDTMTFRKIPVLWLRVSLLYPLPGMATTDLLQRAQNNEFYAPANDLPHTLPQPAHWPDGLYIKTEDPARAPSQAFLDQHIRLFARPAMKELLLTAKGVRIVWMLDQAKRADYMVLRIADFSEVILEPNQLAEIMDQCLNIAADAATSRD